jgi:hypothetical protein
MVAFTVNGVRRELAGSTQRARRPRAGDRLRQACPRLFRFLPCHDTTHEPRGEPIDDYWIEAAVARAAAGYDANGSAGRVDDWRAGHTRG